MSYYHYCPTDAFFNIISNKEIWMSDLSKVNDPNELKHAPPYLEKAISEVFPDHQSWNDFDKHGRKIFSLSFSQKPDLLSQWRAYASNGTGFQIEFDLDMLRALNPHPDKSRLHLKAERVFYDSESFFKSVKDKLEEIHSLADMSAHGLMQIILIYSTAFQYICLLKDDFYSEESEYRLFNIEEISVGNEVKSAALQRRFISKNNKLLSFLALKLLSQDGSERAIKSVTIGPNNDVSVEDLHKFLSLNGFIDVDIRKSAGALRNT